MFYSAVKKEYNVSTIISSPLILSRLEKPDTKLYIVLGVEKEYTYDEAMAISNFIKEGGKVIIADDFGYGNSIARVLSDNSEHSDDEYTGSFSGCFDVRFLEHRLYDSSYIKNTRFVKVNAKFASSKSYEVLLNEPSALGAEGHYTTISETSDNSWLDENRNGIRDVNEEKFPHEVIVSADYGDGQVVFVSDPGLFINNLWNRYENANFTLALIKNLFGIQSNNMGEVIFDESRHITSSSDENLRHTIYNTVVQLTSGIIGIILICIMLLFLILFIALKIKAPKKWLNKNSLNTINLNFAKYPYITHNDILWLRKVFFDKVRNSYAYDEEEFYQISQERLYNLINNRELFEFFTYYIYYPMMINVNYLYRIIELIDRWEPATPSKDFETQDEPFKKMHTEEPLEFELLKDPKFHYPSKRPTDWRDANSVD